MSIKLKTLELIAKEIGDNMTGSEIIRLLHECGVAEKLIVYPNTKWRMINDIFQYLSKSVETEDWQILIRIILAYVHPLNHNGRVWQSENIINRFNSWLEFDWLMIDKFRGEYILTTPDGSYPDEIIEEMMKADQEKNDSHNNSGNADLTKKQIAKLNELDSSILIDEIKIPVPYASYQFQLCKCILKKPKKRWEYDELLEKFGINDLGNGKNRKVYDAMLAINKKVLEITKISDFILYDRKTFFLNPILASKK